MYEKAQPVNRLSIAIRGLLDKGFFHLLSANFVIGFLAFGSQLLVAKFLSPEEIGQIKTMQSYMGVATILAGFGFNTAVLKLCSEKRPDGEKGHLLLKNLTYITIPLVVTLAAIALAAKQGWLSPDENVNRWIIRFMFILPGTAYTAVLMAYIQARKRIHMMAYAQTIVRISGALLLVAMTYMFGFMGFVITSVLVSAIAVGPLLSLVRGDLKSATRVIRPFAQSFHYAKWSTANNTVGTIASFLDIFFLNFMVTDRTEFGYYGIATIFVVGMNSVTTTIQNIAMPYFSEKSGDETEFRRVLRKYQRQLVMLSAGVTAIAILIVPEVIRMIYGASYSNAGIYFRILALKYFFWSCSTLYGVAIWGMGRMNYIFYYLIVSLAVSATLLYSLISAWGIEGAAWAQAGSYAFLFVLVYFTAQYVVKMHFSELRRKNAAVGGHPV